MLEITQIRDQIEKRLGETCKIDPIHKGFSTEKKFKVTTETAVYLLRISSFESYTRKMQEFSPMKDLHKSGLRCNKPIDIFKHEKQDLIYGLYGYLPGFDAEDTMATYPITTQYQIGVEAGKDHIDERSCIQIYVYIAMSIVSTIVWTLKYHPHTWTKIEKKIRIILDHYDDFERVRPTWAI